ncbi:MAG: RagB/SusD family nutrient uptake outer membrane protein, partial [Muribaculaceae bacterium]|nr:RagB/SusD family nutrient uptake outer membrane protein [Muribaculaceae bacterium]
DFYKRQDWVETHDIIQGSLTPSTGFIQRIWKQYYIGITNCNIYMSKIDECTPMLESERTITKAEARAFRAFFYLNLMKLFGPVPLMGDRVSSNDDPISMYQMPRNTVDECFDYIISEFKAILDQNVLMSTFGSDGAYDDKNKGSFTKEVVEMLLCDAYLFRASYLYNGDEYYQEMANQDGTKLFPQQRDEQKWRDLKAQALKIINSNNYNLVYRDVQGKLIANVANACPFNSVFYASMGTSSNEELIYGRTSAGNETYSMVPRFSGIASGLTDTGGGALTIPLEFVDLYFTNKGLRIDDENSGYFTYDVTDPPTANRGDNALTQNAEYKDPISGYSYFKPVSSGGNVSYTGPQTVMKQFYNREARFYLAVTFQNRPWDFKGGVAVQMQYNGNSGSDGKTHDYPIFGTIVRKNYYAKQSNWDMSCEYRLAEVYLDYAEACAELGELTEALEYVNKIRSRAGIGQYGLNAGDTGKDIRNLDKIALPSYDKETVLKAIYRERILELAYENKHYFDVRRWSVADGKWRNGADMTDSWVYPAYHRGGEGGDMTGFNVNNVGQTSENQNVNFYKRIKQQERVFTKRMSLLPIPQEEVNRNKVCVQNREW